MSDEVIKLNETKEKQFYFHSFMILFVYKRNSYSLKGTCQFEKSNHIASLNNNIIVRFSQQMHQTNNTIRF